MPRIHCLNNISKKGTDRLPEGYELTDELANANGVLVRSAQMHDTAFPESLLAIARAGAGVNNIPLDRCAEEGIVVFNTPGANANAVKELLLCGGPDENSVFLTGTLCRVPNLRVTPMGRDICDLMLAVNRSYARSDYLPCICWGLRAREAARWPVGTAVRLEGRFQSRPYIKLTETGPVERVAYEVSVTEAEALEPAETGI